MILKRPCLSDDANWRHLATVGLGHEVVSRMSDADEIKVR